VFKVTKRVYRTDEDGRRELLYVPGMTISDDDAEAAGLLDEDATEEEPSPGAPFSTLAAGATLRIGGPYGAKHTVRGPRQDAPTAPLGIMTLAELREVAATEEIDVADAITRGEFVKAICAARGQLRAARIDAEEKP